MHAQTLNALLVELDGFESDEDGGRVITLAATNQPRVLDRALTRPGRFDRVLHVAPPDIAGRRALLKRLGSKLKLGEGVDLDRLAGVTSRTTHSARPTQCTSPRWTADAVVPPCVSRR